MRWAMGGAARGNDGRDDEFDDLLDVEFL